MFGFVRNQGLKRQILLLFLLLAGTALVVLSRAAWSQGFASQSSSGASSGTFTAGAVTGTITVSSRSNVTAASGLVSGSPTSGTNFPGTWYSPTTPAIGNFQAYLASNSAAGSTGTYTVTYQFNTPVTDPVFHFYNADAANFNFSGTTQVGGGAVALTKLSGNNELELTGSTVNSTARNAANNGCEANDGTNGQGGCGSIRLTGIYQTVSFVVTDTTLLTTASDSFGIGLFVYSDYGDAPSSYGSAAHSGSTALRLGAQRDVESANQASSGATLDDTTTSDDEDALVLASAVTLAQGATHTQSGIACTGTGALYGWIDFNRDGDFADSNERSALSSCSGGTASLSWTLPSGTTALSSGGSFLRIRYAVSSSEISSPSGNASAGEVEDYAVTLNATSADLSVTKTDGITSIASANSTTYTIVVTNGSSATITGATLTDAAATGLVKSAVACAATPGQCTTGSTPTIAELEAGYALPALAAGQTYRITVTATVAATGGSVSNTATIALPGGYSDPSPGSNTATDTNSVTARIAGTPPVLSCSKGTTTHDWTASTSWPAGSVNNNYSVSAIGNVNFSIVKSGGTWVNNATYGGTSPTLQNVDTYGLSPSPYSLLEWIDFATTSDTVTTSITMATAVPGAQFRIFDIDYNAGQFADRLKVTGSYNGSPVSAIITNGTNNYVIGNTAFGDINAADTTAAGTIWVTFSSPIDTITIEYGNHSLSPSNPGGQAMAIDDITFCKPDSTLVVSKSSTVVDDPKNGTTDPKAIPGATMRYCILMSNSGSATLTSIAATDVIPTTLTYLGGSMRSGTTCSGAATIEDDDASDGSEGDGVTASIASGTVTVAASSLAAGGSIALTFLGTIN